MGTTTAKVVRKDTRLGLRLIALRNGLKMTRREVCANTGISPAKLRALESGKDPALSDLINLADAYGYTPGGLVTKLTRR